MSLSETNPRTFLWFQAEAYPSIRSRDQLVHFFIYLVDANHAFTPPGMDPSGISKTIWRPGEPLMVFSCSSEILPLALVMEPSRPLSSINFTDTVSSKEAIISGRALYHPIRVVPFFAHIIPRLNRHSLHLFAGSRWQPHRKSTSLRGEFWPRWWRGFCRCNRFR